MSSNNTDVGAFLKGKRLFVLEDQIDNQIVLRLGLGKLGMIIDFDMWGKFTVSRLLRMPNIDLIILDLMLPNRMSGFSVFQEIRTHHELDHIPIIALSAADPSTALPKCKELGFDGFIAKPIKDEIFPLQIASAIQGEQVWYA